MKQACTVLAATVLALFLVTLCACGGGGGGGGDGSQPGLLSGTYDLFVFNGFAGPPEEGNVNWGEFTSDGAGTIFGGMVTENEDGAVSGPAAFPSLLYTVDASRRMGLNVSGTEQWVGRISADGRVAVLSAVAPGSDPGLMILGRREGTYSDASLSGRYHATAYAYDYASPSDVTYWGSFDFDGAGATTAGSLTANDSGAITGPVPLGATYAVSADGTVSAQIGGADLEGAILADGEIVVLAGGTAATSPPFLLVLTQGTSGATDALLSGNYFLAGLEMDNGVSPSWTGRTFTFTSDTAGLLTLATGGIQNEDGTVTPLPTGGVVTYDVSPSGVLNFATDFALGGVTPSGGFGMFAGQIGAGDRPEFWLLVR